MGGEQGDYEFNSVAFGLNEKEFSNLSEDHKIKIIRLISRISEASFRRGFQHGCFLTEKDRVQIEPEDLRFERSLDDSPWPDGSGGSSSLGRLHCEYGELKDIGFDT